MHGLFTYNLSSKSTIHVRKDTSPMDPMGLNKPSMHPKRRKGHLDTLKHTPWKFNIAFEKLPSQ